MLISKLQIGDLIGYAVRKAVTVYSSDSCSSVLIMDNCASCQTSVRKNKFMLVCGACQLAAYCSKEW